MKLRRAWIRLLLSLYPSEFRDAHGRELTELYLDLSVGIVSLSFDLLVNAARVRLDDTVDRRPLRTERGERSERSRLDGVRSDLRASMRSFRKRPSFVALVIVILALGIGANTMIFIVTNWVVLRPLPFPRPDEVVRVYWRPASFNQRVVALFRERARSFVGLSAFSGWSFTLTGEGEPEELSGAVVSVDYFSVLGVRPRLGRTFAVEEQTPGRSDVCVLSEGLWKRRFGGAAEILGRRIELSGAGRKGCTVIGIVSDSVSVIDPFGPREAFLPLELAPDLEKDDSWFLSVVGRLKPGVSVEEASREVLGLARFARSEMYPRTSEEEVSRARVETLRRSIIGPELPGEILLLSVAAAIVLLVACGNLSTLCLSRYREREREIAVRTALGAGRFRIARQLLTESLLLGLSGGALGAALAAGVVVFFASRLPAELPRVDGLASAGLEPKVLFFAFIASVAASLAFGFLPAVRASRRGPALVASSLRTGATSADHRSGSFDRWLVGLEVAFCLVLLTGAGLVLEGFLRLVRVDPGFDADRVLVAGVQAPESEGAETATLETFRQIFFRVSAIPGVEAVGSIHLLPFDPGNWDFPFYPEGTVIGPSETPPRANFRVISPGYLRAMGVPLLEGRDLDDADRADAPPVGLVNESWARMSYPAESAVGKEVHLFGPDGPSFTIVGVAGDVRQHGLALDPRPEMYRPLDQWALGRNYLAVRTSLSPEGIAPAVREAIWAVDRDLPIVRLSPMSEVVATSVATSRLVTWLVSGFALLSLTLAIVGVYGVSASIASRHRREIGIRMALGASAARVRRRVLVQGMLPVLAGVLFGLALVRGATTALGSLVPDVPPLTAPLLLAAALVLAAVALFACYLPARRASRVDPVTVLRLD